ncbi:hypothetical protein GCK72_019945 [Caenorhabditis remanei]|uniref:DUF38 domain-containing protein n=1 Tax=Caenorhabditis remanei TaxID=31234 RepID=A0A6A5GE21_CAERE|nr:hypothetical protein GCK72_019945 [Caenorhabditis remanei]KAF1753388.1 hypothetical protein GCK72_019945 [Caenorhabditis remanei]
MQEFMTVLPYVEPVHLKRVQLDIKDHTIDMESIFKSEQWKKSNGLQLTVSMNMVSSSQLRSVKWALVKCTNPKEIHIHYDHIDENSLDDLFGRPFRNNRDETVRAVRIPDIEHGFLETKISNSPDVISFIWRKFDNEVIGEYGLEHLAAIIPRSERILSAFENPLILKNVIEYLGCSDIQRMRKLSKNIRNCVDLIKTDPRINKLAVRVEGINTIKLEISLRNEESVSIFYWQNGNNCSVNRNVLKKENFRSIFIKDFESSLKGQRRELEEFCVDFSYRCRENKSEMDDREKLEMDTSPLVHLLEEYLKSRNSNLQVKKLTLIGLNHYYILRILPYIDPDFLEKIEFTDSSRSEKSIDIEELSMLDQWKQANELVISRIIVSTPISKLEVFNFSKVEIMVQTITAEDVLYLKRKFLQPSSLLKLKITLESPITENTMTDLLGRPYSNKFQRSVWYFRMRDNEEALHIMHYMSRCIIFTRIDMSTVPDDALLEY